MNLDWGPNEEKATYFSCAFSWLRSQYMLEDYWTHSGFVTDPLYALWAQEDLYMLVASFRHNRFSNLWERLRPGSDGQTQPLMFNQKYMNVTSIIN